MTFKCDLRDRDTTVWLCMSPYKGDCANIYFKKLFSALEVTKWTKWRPFSDQILIYFFKWFRIFNFQLVNNLQIWKYVWTYTLHMHNKIHLFHNHSYYIYSFQKMVEIWQICNVLFNMKKKRNWKFTWTYNKPNIKWIYVLWLTLV